MSDKLEITAIKTNKGYYLSLDPNGTYGTSKLLNYYMDGTKPTTTWHSQWVFVTSDPISIQQEKKQSPINHRFELIDKTMESDKIPFCFFREECAYYDDDVDYWKWKEKYEHLQSLYGETWDEQPNIIVDIPFSLNIILTLEELREHDSFGYTVQKTQYRQDGQRQITPSEVQHQLIDRIIFPPLILPDRPCKLSSKQTYDIVRQHVKDNLNPQFAEITSDYKFCFTVKKKIRLVAPLSYQTDINALSQRKRKPKYETRYRKDRLVEVFAMTNKEESYKGYTSIKGFQGNNQTDLKSKIDTFLLNLMDFLNEPLVDCGFCEGNGVVKENFDKNER